MIHRNISFLIVFSACLVLTLYSLRAGTAVLPCLIIAILAGGAGISLFGFHHPPAKRAGFFLIAAALGFFSGFFLSSRIDAERGAGYTGIRLSRVRYISGYIEKDSVARKDGGYIHYIGLVSVRSADIIADARGAVMLVSPFGKKRYTGEKISAATTLSVFDGSDESDIHFIASAREDNIKADGFTFPVWEIRYSIIRMLEESIGTMGYPASSLFEALFLGVREHLPDTLHEGFEKTGTLHILALSGLHVGIIYLFITLLLFPLPFHRVKIIAGFFLVCFYLFIVGPRPSLLRAGIMLIVFGTGYLVMREREPLNLLAIAAAVILFIDPLAAFSLSFQLSFSAMLGIIILGRPLARFLAPWLPRFIGFPLALSIGAQTATAPIIMASFGIIYPAGILVTLLIVPLVTVFLWTGIIFMILVRIPVSFIGWTVQYLLSFLYRLIFLVNDFFSAIPGISVQLENSFIVFFLLVLLIFLWPLSSIARIIGKKDAGFEINAKAAAGGVR